eukprot:5596381-Prymnesium_polylepis.1
MQDELHAITDKFGLTAAGSCEKGCSGCLACFKILDEQPPPRLDPLAYAPIACGRQLTEAARQTTS